MSKLNIRRIDPNASISDLGPFERIRLIADCQAFANPEDRAAAEAISALAATVIERNTRKESE